MEGRKKWGNQIKKFSAKRAFGDLSFCSGKNNIFLIKVMNKERFYTLWREGKAGPPKYSLACYYSVKLIKS